MAQGIFSAVLYIAIKYAIRLFRICVRIAFFYRNGNVVNVLVQHFFVGLVSLFGRCLGETAEKFA